MPWAWMEMKRELESLPVGDTDGEGWMGEALKYGPTLAAKEKQSVEREQMKMKE